MSKEELGLSKEDIQWITELSDEMKSQNNRGTASPMVINITEEQVVTTTEDLCEDVAMFIDGEMYYEWEDLREYLIDYYTESNNKLFVKQVAKISSFEEFDNSEPFDDLDAQSISTRTERVVSKDSNCGVFFTAKEADNYIKNNKHNLNNPETYGSYAGRNNEMVRIFEIIHKIAEASKQEKCND